MKFYFALLVFAFMIPASGQSQICTGSLGDPVVNVSFGSGQNPGAPLPARITNYIYSSAPCPGDGAYTIVNSTMSCWGNTWHSLSEDHTPGDVNGYMMLANSSFNPGDFYTDTVSGLCNNTTYEFAVYVMNMLRDFACSGNGQLPNLTFRIQTVSGTTLASFNSGNIPMTDFATWKQIGFYFTTPAGVDKVILRLTNNAQGGCGNDLMLDGITFRACGPEVKAAIAANAASNEVVVCEGGSKDFTFNASISAGYNNPVIQWQRSLNGGSWTDIAGATRTAYTRTGSDTGEFRYRFAVSEPGNLGSPNCRIFSNVLSVRVAPLPRIALAVNRPICVGGEIKFTASGGGTYAWSGPAGFTSALAAPALPAVTAAAGKYKVLITSIYNCVKADSADIIVFPQAVARAGNDQTICEGQTATLTGTGGIEYNWSPVSTLNSPNTAATIARPSDTTLYSLRIRDVNGCTASDSVMLFVLRKPTANAGLDTSIFEGGSAQLQGRVGGTSVTFAWTPTGSLANAGALNPVASPTDNVTYTLRATSGVGCGTAEDEVFVRVYKNVSVPNAFSPNGDGVNDTWNIGQLSNYPEARLQVFNRYGKELFRSSGYPRPWNGTIDGRPLAAGTYYYVINLKNGLAPLTGWVFIVR
jgi:gliding motility-associated-like protein